MAHIPDTREAVPSVAVGPLTQRKAASRSRKFLARVRHQYGAIAGAFILLIVLIVTIFAPIIAPYSPTALVDDRRLGPSREHIMGTDEIGRDTFSRVVYGGRVSLRVGALAVLIGATVGTLLGMIAGYVGGWLDALIMRIIDVMLAFPGILLALVIVAILGPSINNVMIAVGIEFIPAFVRTVRGATLSVKEEEYVTAARAVGARTGRIVGRHVLPNVFSTVIVLGTLAIGFAILAAAGLSFLGLGAQPPTPEWGAMLSDARNYLRGSPHMAIFPGAAIMLVVLSLNLLGDGLRELLDPRMRT
jgi:peptide/nickel transport system permease protein